MLKDTVSNFQTEHVLEWQTVEQFFGKYLVDYFANTKFTSPDPKDRTETNWCGIWSKTWEFTRQTLALTDGGPEMKPFQWIADVYPSKEK